jgi:hypothetical protein
MMRTILFTIGSLVTLPLAIGQSARPLVGKDIAVPSARFPAEWYPKQGGSTTAPVAGAPYSATWKVTTTVLDGEGKPIGTSAWRTLKWRDSAGRNRDEMLLSELPNTIANNPNEITAVDTVQHCQFTWSAPVVREQDREAVVNCNSLEEYRSDDSLAKKMTDPKPEIRHEQLGTMVRTTTITPLGTRTMQGLEAVGIRTVTTDVDAAGRLQDTTEGEIWWSPALYLSLLTTVKSRQSVVTMELTGIKREEPDPGLFYPPEGYRIRKEAEVPPLPVPPQ